MDVQYSCESKRVRSEIGCRSKESLNSDLNVIERNITNKRNFTIELNDPYFSKNIKEEVE